MFASVLSTKSSLAVMRTTQLRHSSRMCLCALNVIDARRKQTLRCDNFAFILSQTRHYSDRKQDTQKTLKLDFVDDQPKLTHTERLKRLFQNYGKTAVILHITISLASLGFWYSLISFGVDLTNYVNTDAISSNLSKVVVESGNFAIAYAIHKAIMPARIAATVLLTPPLASWLRKRGIIKKPHQHL